MNRILIAGIVIIIAACVGLYFWAEWEIVRFDESLPELPVPVQEAHTDPHTGHNHGPGEHHGDMIEVECLEPPPEGYTYIWDDDPQHELGTTARRDASGKPILLPEGDPIFTVRTELGFRPTPEEFARYEEVRKELDRLYGLDPGRVQQLKAQLEQMEREYIGEIPSVYWSHYFPTDWTEEQIRAADWRALKEASRLKYAEYRKVGLDYLIPPQYR